MEKVRIHVFVSGSVQGINFRYYTKQVADSLGITGWARNLSDGRVEVVAEGSEARINNLIEFLKKGPPGAKIVNIEIEKEEYRGEFKHFDIDYTL